MRLVPPPKPGPFMEFFKFTMLGSIYLTVFLLLIFIPVSLIALILKITGYILSVI